MSKFYRVMQALILLLSPVAAQAGAEFSAGVKLLPANNWSGSNNHPGEKDYEARSTQLALIGSVRRDKFYALISVAGAEYGFSSPAPDLNNDSGSTSVNNVDVKLSETDLLVGYYILPKLSLFADYKAVGYQWKNNNKTMSYGGIGLGVSGYYPINPEWSFYGNFGVLGDMKVRSDGNQIGSATGIAMEAGAIHPLTAKLTLSMGLKVQGQNVEFDSGEKQSHARNGLIFGLVHQF